MKISTKGRYALRTMIDLTVNDTGTLIPLKDIATRQNISLKIYGANNFTINKIKISKKCARK